MRHFLPRPQDQAALSNLVQSEREIQRAGVCNPPIPRKPNPVTARGRGTSPGARNPGRARCQPRSRRGAVGQRRPVHPAAAVRGQRGRSCAGGRVQWHGRAHVCDAAAGVVWPRRRCVPRACYEAEAQGLYVDVFVRAPVRRMCGFSSLFCCSYRPVFFFWRANPASTPTPQPHASSVRAHSSPHAVHLPQIMFYYGEMASVRGGLRAHSALRCSTRLHSQGCQGARWRLQLPPLLLPLPGAAPAAPQACRRWRRKSRDYEQWWTS